VILLILDQILCNYVYLTLVFHLVLSPTSGQLQHAGLYYKIEEQWSMKIW